MYAVAVGGLDEQEICARDRLGIAQDGLIGLTEIARKYDFRLLFVLRHGHLENRRAEDMTRIVIFQMQVVYVQHAVIRHGFEVLERGKGIRLRVERHDRRLAAARVLAVHDLRVALLDVRRIREHDAHEVAGRLGRVDFPAKSLAYELWDAPAVVDVRVRQKDRLDLRRVERERLIVHLAQTARPLIHAAVHKIFAIARMDQIARSRDNVCRP